MSSRTLVNVIILSLTSLVVSITDSYSKAGETHHDDQRSEVKVISNAKTPVPPVG